MQSHHSYPVLWSDDILDLQDVQGVDTGFADKQQTDKQKTFLDQETMMRWRWTIVITSK